MKARGVITMWIVQTGLYTLCVVGHRPTFFVGAREISVLGYAQKGLDLRTMFGNRSTRKCLEFWRG